MKQDTHAQVEEQISQCPSNGLGRRQLQAHVRARMQSSKETRALSVPFLRHDWLEDFWITAGAGVDRFTVSRRTD